MTNEKKLDALYCAVNKAWNYAFDGCEWVRTEENSFQLGTDRRDSGFAFFIGANEDVFSGMIWINYEPDDDAIEICIKNRPIQKKFKDDYKELFEKYSPFNMKVTFENKTMPIISVKEKVEPENFLIFLRSFKKAYKENYPLFYLFTVSEREWYEGFCVYDSDC